MASWLWGTSQFDENIDKATSELNLAGSEDIALNLEIADQIRSKSVAPKDAMRAIKRRLNHANPNVQLLTLSLLDLCVKNGGDHFLQEIASREFMDNMVSILRVPSVNRDVRETSLRLIQSWAFGFEKRSGLSYVGEVYKKLGDDGFKFPPRDSVAANSAMVDTMTAPEWIDSDVCLRCRTPFTFTNRKHHCRNCGQVFDQACSSKSMPLPHFGITQEVRVCDSCFIKLKMKNERPTPGPKHHRNQSRGTRVKSAQELADEEFQRAIQLSLEESRRLGSGRGAGYVPASALSGASEPPVIDQKQRPTQPQQDEEDDPELRAAIEASLREYQAPKPSAPDAEENQVDPGLDLHPLETDAIMTFSQTVEEAHSRGTRDLVRYPGVGELYDRANKLRPKLAISLDDTGKKEQILTDMHDKLSEAVKLYDRILTEQVNPARRYNQYYGAQQQRQSTMASAYPALASSVPGSSQQPPQMVPSQWSQQPSAVPPVQDYGQAYQQHQPEQSPYPPQQQRQYSYSQYQTPSAPPPPPSTVPSAPYPPQQQQYQQPQQPMSPPPVSANVYPDQKFAHPQQYQHAQQAPMAASTASLPGTAISPPPQQVQQTYNLASIPSAPVTYAASPTPASPPPQQIASSFSPMPPPPTTYAPQPVVAAFPPPPSSSPVRSIVPPPSTIQQTAPTVPDPTPVPSAQYAPTSINPSYVASVHQTQPQNLPAFPLAPTTAPHNSSSAFMYSSPPAAAAGIEQSQPKEAMLISFD